MISRLSAFLLFATGFLACTYHEPPELSLRQTAQAASEFGAQPCSTYLFDSALANLEYSTPFLRHAHRIVPYAPADTNLFGWTQMRYVIQLVSPSEVRQPYDIIYLHGGGGDVGHAALGDNLVYELVEKGYNVWCVEYRRGWHEGSYNRCIPRDMFKATEADFQRLDSAAVWALRDVRLAIDQIAANTTDSFILYGSSFGAYLALMSGPFDDEVRVRRNRIKGCLALYGCVRPGTPLGNPMPTFMLHGAADSLNGPDRQPIFNIPPPKGRMMEGSRAVYGRIHQHSPTWLMMHDFGHGTGPITSSGLREVMEKAFIKRRIPVGRYRLLPDGRVLAETPSGAG